MRARSPRRPRTSGVVAALRWHHTIGAQIPVADVAAARVGTFEPGIEVEKSASQATAAVGDEITYTYRVRNTGDVPLANVAGRISDDTCSPVRLVSGDTDGDGLLDTPNSIFEDARNETWVFRCTTEVDETTTNTVVVSGRPVDSSGAPLCGQRQDPSRVFRTCNVRDTDEATVSVSAVAVEGVRVGVGDLAGTGAPGLLGLMLTLGGLLVLAGVSLEISARRRTAASTALTGDARPGGT